ncbi:MAG: ACP phosphodiesterase [Blastocatellia bacterium]
MNYLAHAFLAGDSPQALVGALLGDFVKGAAKNNYAPLIQRNIELHRRIDAYTDAHPIVRAAKPLIASERRRFAGILLDIFYDHYLAKHWARFSPVALPTFTQQVYAALHAHHALLPERLQKMLPYMQSEDWLASYAQIAWIEVTLARVARRLRPGNALASGSAELQQHYTRFETDFLTFFPDLILLVETEK